MAISRVTRGGGAPFKAEIRGLKELEAKLRDLLPDNPKFAIQAQTVVYNAASKLAERMRSRARTAGWAGYRIHSRGQEVTGLEAIESIFSYGRRPAEGKRRRRINALAGVSKPRTMFEWTAGPHAKSLRAKVPPGGAVAMSLATALEFGTTKLQPRPAIRPAITESKSQVISEVAEGFRFLIQQLAKR